MIGPAGMNLMGEPPVSFVDMVQLSYMEWMKDQENERFEKYAEFRAYYEGEHLAQLTKRLAAFLKVDPDQSFSFNVCPIIVDSLAEKLKVSRFECVDSTQNDTFAAWWDDNRMDGEQGVAHLAGVRDGDTYVLVEWDNENKRPRFTQENAYDLDEGMHVIYSDEHRRQPLAAVKQWNVYTGESRVTRRKNLYYPDRIEKYTDGGSGGDWQPHFDEDNEWDEEANAFVWPLPWVDKQGEPLGIPVIHFRNKDQGKSYGESELEDPIPPQNALNKTVIDLLAAADTTAFQMPWMTGGKPEGMAFAPGSWTYTTNVDAKVGHIPAADLSGLIDLKDSFTADAAKLTRTPLSFFQLTGAIAAAGTLKEQRAGLIAKALDRQVTFGNCWEDVMAMGRKLNEAFGSGGMDLTKRISTIWRDDEKPNGKDLADEVETAHRAGAMSTKTKVKTLHPDWEEKAVDEEVALIQKEMGIELEPPEVEAGTQGLDQWAGAPTGDETTAAGSTEQV